MKRLLALALAAVLTVAVFSACTAGAPIAKITVNPPDAGVNFNPPEPDENIEIKVAVLDPAACEIIYALGYGDSVVARTPDCNAPSEVLEVPVIEPTLGNPDSLLAVSPNVVFIHEDETSEQWKKFLDGEGIGTVISSAVTMEDVYMSIELTGVALGCVQGATELINSIMEQFRAVDQNVPAPTNLADRKKVYVEMDNPDAPLAFGAFTYVNELCKYLKCDNIFSDKRGSFEVDLSLVPERDPDVIFIVSSDANAAERVKAREGWSGIKAVRNDKVFVIDPRIARPGPRLRMLIMNIHFRLYDAPIAREAFE